MWLARRKVPDGITRGEAHEPESHLIPLVLDVALGRRPSIRIYGDDYPTPTAPVSATTSTSPTWPTRTCWRSPRSMLSRAGQSGPLIYNLGNGKGFSVREVIESARRVTGHPIPAEDSSPARRATRPCWWPARESHARAGLEAALHQARRHSPHGVDLASETLRGIGRRVWRIPATASWFLHLKGGLLNKGSSTMAVENRKSFVRAFVDFFILFSGISTASNLARTQGRQLNC
jgi:hypothetical protein